MDNFQDILKTTRKQLPLKCRLRKPNKLCGRKNGKLKVGKFEINMHLKSHSSLNVQLQDQDTDVLIMICVREKGKGYGQLVTKTDIFRLMITSS